MKHFSYLDCDNDRDFLSNVFRENRLFLCLVPIFGTSMMVWFYHNLTILPHIACTVDLIVKEIVEKFWQNLICTHVRILCVSAIVRYIYCNVWWAHNTKRKETKKNELVSKRNVKPVNIDSNGSFDRCIGISFSLMWIVNVVTVSTCEWVSQMNEWEGGGE